MAIMDVEFNPSPPAAISDINEIAPEEMIEHLVGNDQIYFKHQQRGEADLNKTEKSKLARELFSRNKVNFLTRFGKYLKAEHLNYFKQYELDSTVGYEVSVLLRDLMKTSSDKGHRVNVRNRRYEALKHLIAEKSYFSEVEMMKRNPLLYDQLIGKYMTDAEKHERDKIDKDNLTIVKIIMEGIERDETENKRILQENDEDNIMEEDDSDSADESQVVRTRDDDSETETFSQPSTSAWGEIPGDNTAKKSRVHNRYIPPITEKERNLLKEEFTTSMFQSFLDGKDTDFDYNDVDNNEKYDNIDILSKDEEEKYFDSEDPADVEIENNSVQLVQSDGDSATDDELDMYMNALNQHPGVNRLSKAFKDL